MARVKKRESRLSRFIIADELKFGPSHWLAESYKKKTGGKGLLNLKSRLLKNVTRKNTFDSIGFKKKSA